MELVFDERPEELEGLELSLPSGVSHALWDQISRNGPSMSGSTSIQGHNFTINVPDIDDVLFPTDVGMTGVVALTRSGVVVDGAHVLDVGCGSGIYDVVVLMAGAASVTAIDVHPPCGSVTANNIVSNGLPVDRFQFEAARVADFRNSRPSSFDLIICNPPHFPQSPAYDHGRGVDVALIGGRNGRELYDELFSRLDDLLAPKGTFLLVHSSLTNIQYSLRWLEHHGYMAKSILKVNMDINLLAYKSFSQKLVDHLERLRQRGEAEFDDYRFYVQVFAVTHSKPV